jgi:lysine-ketoglutarate reductase/saccharopine dehydrogenase-like protein (TIGR00300 family)
VSGRPSRTLVLEGHIIDSLTLPRLLDLVMDLGGSFDIQELRVGHHKTDPSFCRIEVAADDDGALDEIVLQARGVGAVAMIEEPVRTARVEQAGVYPEGFYSSSNLPTSVLVDGTWLDVERQEMDCAVAVDRAAGRAWCIPFYEAEAGMEVVVGHAGVRISPLERSRQTEIFSFMSSEVSAEKPKKLLIGKVAEEMRSIRQAGGSILVVSGPAVVHTDAGQHLSRLIELGYVQVLFAGNALAVHDVEAALFGTALGVNLESGRPIEHGHEHHMRAINRVRAAGGLAAMVESGQLRKGVMKSAIEHRVEIVLGGSVRDDGPLPDVIEDMGAVQRRMRQAIWGVGGTGPVTRLPERVREPRVRLALMLSTMLHSIATGNMLPAAVRTICIDINPAVVTKLADRGSWQSIGLVTDVESFLRELVLALEAGA